MDQEYKDWHEANVVQPALQLIADKLRNPDDFASEVLFHDEFGAEDWSVEIAVECLFRYATKYGWSD